MKKVLIAFLYLIISSTLTLQAQTEEIFNRSTKETIQSFFDDSQPTLKHNEFKILLHLEYGSTKIKNSYDIASLGSGKIKKINLYYSDFPSGRNFDDLNKKRINTLLYHAFYNISDPDIEWKIIKQTNCKSKSDAYQLFHGFEVILEISDDFDLANVEVDTAFQDFVVEDVLKRNDWHEMLIVSDFTGSMSPYIAQLFLWLKLNTIDDRIKQFVFFNDGDSQLDELKKIGKTGGIYQSKSKDYDEIEQVAIQCMLSGSGGDAAENDLEALINGMKLCPDCKENILIVDNKSPVRDYELLNKIEKPIRIIVCGSDGNINIEYLNIARLTGGSIHLIEKDLFDLIKINEGEEVTIGNVRYTIRNNRFEVIKKI